ncbi:MAG: sigma-70 family RNA polymerase sigma factor [Myxococcota bacterium]
METYQRYGRALLRKAERILGAGPEAEDVVQGLFVDLWARQDLGRQLPYLFRAVTHRCLNHLRDSKNRLRLLDQNGEAAAPRETPRAETQVLSAELLRHLAARLDQETWEIVVYRYLDDLGQEEIAALMNLNRKTVIRRLERAKEALAALGGPP